MAVPRQARQLRLHTVCIFAKERNTKSTSLGVPAAEQVMLKKK